MGCEKPKTMMMRVPVTFRDFVFKRSHKHERNMREELSAIVEQLVREEA